jgi:hypothetical protein
MSRDDKIATWFAYMAILFLIVALGAIHRKW